MAASLEARYTLFSDIAAMLDPAALSALLGKPVSRAVLQPMDGHNGLAGGHLSYINTDQGRLVLKRMSIETDWIMFSSDDTRCRSVTLWKFGLLDAFLPHIEHKIIACARDGAGWAILMRDLTGFTYSRDNPIAPELVPVFLDALARLHAAFWNDPTLHDPRLGLCSAATLLNQTAPLTARQYTDYPTSVIPGWIAGGWDVLPQLLDRHTMETMNRLSEDPRPLLDATARYPFTLLHGDYRLENFAAQPGKSPVLLDWQESSCSLMTIDLAWLVKHGYVTDAMSRSEAENLYRERLETHLGYRFDEVDWEAMLALGRAVDALRFIGFPGYWSVRADTEEGRQWNVRMAKQLGQYVMDAERWM